MWITKSLSGFQYRITTGSQINILLYTEPIMFGLMNIIIVYLYKTITIQVLYYFNNILKVLLIIQTSFNLIPCELDITSTPFCDKKILTYKLKLPPSGNKVGFNLLDDEYFKIPYITDKIPNFQPVINFQHRLKKIRGSFLSMEKSLSKIKVRLMNSTAIKFQVENPR